MYLHLNINRVRQIDVAVIAKIHDIKELLARGRVEPHAVFPELKRLAASDQWQTREVAATALVEIGKRHPAAALTLRGGGPRTMTRMSGVPQVRDCVAS